MSSPPTTDVTISLAGGVVFLDFGGFTVELSPDQARDMAKAILDVVDD
jgi:hypothetical protein